MENAALNIVAGRVLFSFAVIASLNGFGRRGQAHIDYALRPAFACDGQAAPPAHGLRRPVAAPVPHALMPAVRAVQINGLQSGKIHENHAPFLFLSVKSERLENVLISIRGKYTTNISSKQAFNRPFMARCESIAAFAISHSQKPRKNSRQAAAVCGIL
jgi:hypothetical protein